MDIAAAYSASKKPSFSQYQSDKDNPARMSQSDVFTNRPQVADPEGFMMQPNTVDQHMGRAIAYDNAGNADPQAAAAMADPQQAGRDARAERFKQYMNMNPRWGQNPGGGRMIDRGVKPSPLPMQMPRGY